MLILLAPPLLLLLLLLHGVFGGEDNSAEEVGCLVPVDGKSFVL